MLSLRWKSNKRYMVQSQNGTISNSYTMGCPPVRGDNPRALASGLSYVQVDKHGITILYQLHHLALNDIFRPKFGKGGIMFLKVFSLSNYYTSLHFFSMVIKCRYNIDVLF